MIAESYSKYSVRAPILVKLFTMIGMEKAPGPVIVMTGAKVTGAFVANSDDENKITQNKKNDFFFKDIAFIKKGSACALPFF